MAMASQNGIPGPIANSNIQLPPSTNNGGKKEEPNESPMIPSDVPMDDWSSERKIISALSLLQEMEAKIFQLRTLVPGRLLSPLRPIAMQEESERMPSSPQELFERLSRAAKEGVAEVEAFKAAWNVTEMKSIQERVQKLIEEDGGNVPSASSVWNQDYSAILRVLNVEETRKKTEAQLVAEQSEKARLASVDGGWQAIIESIRPATPGLTINILASNDVARFSVLLHSTSTLFLVQNSDVVNMEDWDISIHSRGATSKTVDGIFNCVSTRDRKWDLPYFLNMLSSYVDVKRTNCIACKKLLDSDAQLPTIRKPRLVDFSNAKSTFAWDAYHTRCV